jgi:DNA primase
MAAAKEWVDFKVVKEKVTMQMVLDHYQITGLKKSGDELRGACPIHQGAANSRQFTVNISKNAFHCFYTECKARGNVLDFVAKMENCTVREAALKLASWVEIGEKESAPVALGESPAELREGLARLEELLGGALTLSATLRARLGDPEVK